MTTPTEVFQRGDIVRVTFQGSSARAFVALASENGESLMLLFDAMLGGYVGSMPLLWKDTGFVDMVQGEAVRIERERRR